MKQRGLPPYQAPRYNNEQIICFKNMQNFIFKIIFPFLTF